MESELRALSEKLEAEVERRTLERDRIWNVSEDLLAVSNFEGYFLSMNPAWSDCWAGREDEIKSMHVSELRHPDDAPPLSPDARSLLKAFRPCAWKIASATRTVHGAGCNGP